MMPTLRQKLTQIGVRFNETIPNHDINVEKTLLEGTEQGRKEPRIFWGTLLWMTTYIDLVNISRFSNMLKDYGDPAALGAICDLAYEKNANRKFLAIRQRCYPKKNKEMLFSRMAEMEVTKREVISNALPLFLKWGLYCNYVNLMEGAICNRAEVLKRNQNLRLRALFGANSRADILNWLLSNEAAHARKIARELSLSYQPVYTELHRLAADKTLTAKQIGNICVFSLTDIMKQWLIDFPIPAGRLKVGSHYNGLNYLSNKIVSVPKTS